MGPTAIARRGRRLVILPATLALCLAGLLGAPQVAAAAAASCLVDGEELASVQGDLNGDARADVTVGVPDLMVAGHPDNGGVDVLLSDGGRQRITLDTILGSGGEQADARFGASVSAIDVDADGCDDLAVGAPGLNQEGAVFLLRSSRLGVTSAGAVRVTAPGGAPGDRFGASVVTIERQDGFTDLYVGAPGRKVDGQAGAGAVYHFLVSSSYVVTARGALTYASPKVEGDPAAGDGFGSVLAPSFGHLLVGVPKRKVQGHPGAGEVVVASTPGALDTTQILNQATPGMPGAPEDGDHFGAALTADAIGVPGEDVGKIVDAGQVQVIDQSTGRAVAGRSYTQDTPGVPSTAEKGDRFGAALADGVWFLCQEESDLAVGSPGEGVGRANGAGTVTVLGLASGGKPCSPRLYRQGSNLAGTLAAGNHVGATLATLSGDAFQDEDQRSSLAIGVPGRDGAVRNAGAVLTGLHRSDPLVTAVGGQQRDQGFGSVLATLPQ